VFVKACAIDAGNPHLLVYSDQPQLHQQQMGHVMAQPAADWQQHEELSADFRALVADGCNIGFMRVNDDRPQRVSLSVWERGSGPTLACGSAACAAAVVLLQTQVFSTIEVEQAGGELILEHRQADVLRVTGSATHVFSGLLNWHSLHTE
jgi:diaminopimelate epimerase